MIKNNYLLKKLTFSSIEYDQIVCLFKKDGDNLHFDKEFLEWQYEKNPLGQAVGFNAYYGSQLIAHYAAIPVNFKKNGVMTKGLLSINTRTDRDHQGKGLFTLLAEETFSYATELGYQFVVGVANDNSVYGFTKKLSFQHVLKLESRLTFDVKEKDRELKVDFLRIWDSASVSWRLSNPKNKYTYKMQDKSILLLGKTRNFRALVGIISEIELPRHCAPSAFSLNPVKLWIGVDPRIDWSRTLSLKIPDKYRPVTLNLIYRSLNGTDLIDPGSIKFWAMDFDAY